MQMDRKEPAAVPAGGKPPSICDRLQRAFHTRPGFRLPHRLTVRHQDGGAAPGADKPAATGAGAGGAPGAAATHGGPLLPPPVPLPPPTPLPSPVDTAPAPTVPLTLPPTPKRAGNNGDKPQHVRQIPVSAPTVTVTTSNVAQKAAVATAGGMPVPVPPPAVTGRPPAAAKAGDNAQQSKGKTRVGSRVRKALSSK